MKTIVIGLGNPVLGDDGVGWHVVEHVKQRLSERIFNSFDPIDITCLTLGGLGLMEHMIGYDRAILIDAIHLRNANLGEVYKMALQDLPNHANGHTSSAHDTTLQTAIKLGAQMDVRLPKDIVIVGIQTTNVYDFSENLSSKVESAIPIASDVVINSILQDHHNNHKQIQNNINTNLEDVE